MALAIHVDHHNAPIMTFALLTSYIEDTNTQYLSLVVPFNFLRLKGLYNEN
jgi:hypothetical protein